MNEECILWRRRVRSASTNGRNGAPLPREGRMEHEIRIVSGGKAVGLNNFAERIVRQTMLGLLGSLRDVDLAEEITVTIVPAPAARA
jgi:hypothetical protein